MSTPIRRLPAAHPRRTWLTFAAVSALGLAAAVVVAVAEGAGRIGVTMTAFCGVVVIVVLAAFLDALVKPGSQELRQMGHRNGPGLDGAYGDLGGGIGGVSGGGDHGSGGGH